MKSRNVCIQLLENYFNIGFEFFGFLLVLHKNKGTPKILLVSLLP